MSKPSQRIINGLLKFHYSHLTSSSNSPTASSLASKIGTSISRPYSNFSFVASRILNSSFASKPTSSNGGLSQLLSKPKQNWSAVRYYSLKSSSDMGKMTNGNLAKKVFEKPSKAVSSTFSRYRAAIGLQIEAFWKRNFLFLIGAGGVVICALLWRIMFGIANTFVGLSEGMAKYGFLALSSAMVAFAVSCSPDQLIVAFCYNCLLILNNHSLAANIIHYYGLKSINDISIYTYIYM